MFELIIFIILFLVFLFSNYKFKKNILKVYQTFDLYFIRNNISKKKYYLKNFCILMVILFLVLSIYDFKTEKQIVNEKIKQYNIVFLTDVSRSMQAKDIYTDRLNSMKLFVKQIINEFNNIRISLISFAGKPELQCVFTKDKDMFNFFLDRLDTQSSDVYGTNIGDALKKTYHLINDYMFKDSLIILLSDGEDFNDSTYDIINQNKNIPVFVIGFGTETGYNLKINDKVILTKLDTNHLKKIAALSKGDYIQYTNYKSVRNWLNNNIEKYKTRVINKKYVVYEKQYYWFILISFLFFVLWSIIKI